MHILAQYVECISNSVTWVEGDPIVIESALAQDIWTTSRIPFDSSGVHFNEFVDLL